MTTQYVKKFCSQTVIHVDPRFTTTTRPTQKPTNLNALIQTHKNTISETTTLLLANFIIWKNTALSDNTKIQRSSYPNG